MHKSAGASHNIGFIYIRTIDGRDETVIICETFRVQRHGLIYYRCHENSLVVFKRLAGYQIKLLRAAMFSALTRNSILLFKYNVNEKVNYFYKRAVEKIGHAGRQVSPDAVMAKARPGRSLSAVIQVFLLFLLWLIIRQISWLVSFLSEMQIWF